MPDCVTVRESSLRSRRYLGNTPSRGLVRGESSVRSTTERQRTAWFQATPHCSSGDPGFALGLPACDEESRGDFLWSPFFESSTSRRPWQSKAQCLIRSRALGGPSRSRPAKGFAARRKEHFFPRTGKKCFLICARTFWQTASKQGITKGKTVHTESNNFWNGRFFLWNKANC